MIITSWDDYSEENLKIAFLLKKHKLPGIFFIEVDDFKKIDQIVKLSHEGFEIGCHTFSHPQDLKLLNFDGLNLQIRSAKRTIERELEKPISWFCYPRGRFDDKVVSEVRRAGFRNARTTRIGFGGAAFEKAGFHCFQRREYNGKDWMIYLKEMIDKYDPERGDIHIWGHGWEIEKYHEWEKLDEVLRYLSEKNNAKNLSC